MPTPRESKLEKYIKDFVKTNTAEIVELQLQDAIFIKPLAKRGSTILGIFWANVLQHQQNYPKESHRYWKEFDRRAGEEKLMVVVNQVTFSVYLTTGTFSIAADYVYAWFTKCFQDLLTKYDPEYSSCWVYCPTQFQSKSPTKEIDTVYDVQTPTEAYLLLCNTNHQRDFAFEKRLHEGIDGLIAGVGDLSVHKGLWKGEDLQAQLEDLKEGGLYDSFNCLYKLYMSLLYKWFGQENTKIFISSPQVDAKILKEVIGLFLRGGTAPKATVEACYLDFRCDGCNTAIQVKKDAISDYCDQLKAYIEYHMLRKMIHVSAKVTGSFMAAVCDGKAEVLVATPNLHSNHLFQNRLETAWFGTMEENAFMTKYIGPCATPNVSVTY